MKDVLHAKWDDIHATSIRVAAQMDLVREGPGGVDESFTILVAHARVLAVTLGIAFNDARALKEMILSISKMMFTEAFSAHKETQEVREMLRSGDLSKMRPEYREVLRKEGKDR